MWVLMKNIVSPNSGHIVATSFPLHEFRITHVNHILDTRITKLEAFLSNKRCMKISE